MIVDNVTLDSDISVDDESKTISYKMWIKRGSMLVNRAYLDNDDPMHPFNLVLSHGLDPEAYGLVDPIHEFADVPKSELVRQLIAARRELVAMYRAGF